MSFDLNVYLFAYLQIQSLTLIGRISAPKEIQLNLGVDEKGEKKTKVVYMNINISRELWKDVKFAFF